jgi:hypothetical protein
MSFISMSITAQKINLDSLNFKQLNQYMIKANKMRNAGMYMTISGVGIAVVGYIASAIWASSTSIEGWGVFQTLIPMTIGASVGIPASLIGISLWMIGGSREKKAELTLQKFNLSPEKSMVLRVGITFRF